MVVRRRKIFKDVLDFLKYNYVPSKYLRVTFMHEPAVDNGGPLRELFTLLLKEVAENNSLFCGPLSHRCIMHNVGEVEKKTYYYVGMMMGLSIIYGGPGPTFFSPSVANYIVYGFNSNS